MRGACDCSASAAKVRDEPKTAELPTLMTAMRIMPFMTLGRTVVPALSMAMTKGLAVASAPLSAPRSRASLEGTKSPTNSMDTM